jgi:putative transposase
MFTKEQTMKKRFTEEQMIGVLREHAAGGKATELCRRHGISQATLYKWKAKFGGMEASDAKKLKALEAENAKLKKLVADLSLDKLALQDLLSKNW